MDIPALPAGNPQDPLPLRTNDDRGFGDPATAKAADRSRRNHVLAKGNIDLDLF